MSMQDQIAKLEMRMAQAAAEGDFETAALLRDAIARLRSGESALREQIPGKMGLGSSQEAYVRDPARALPKKPDPMTKGHRAGGRRRR
jgi:Helicase subunit of the DNA excision repair complex